ncbi:MAG: hypothetical protein CSB55_07730 [Candidatus Cloacimonadota bacterium]|nr:MAG: hypothetical protein CSB55_07730 [Candidatus Cloacimonadota bacterium]
MKKILCISLFILTAVMSFAQETFILKSNPYMEFSTSNTKQPAFADLDNDGRLDMIVRNNNKFSHYEQTEINSEEFVLISSNFNDIPVGYPVFTDLDNDGLLDLVIGLYASGLKHYKQSGSNSLIFEEVENSFPGIDELGNKPTFTDIDGNGRLDLVLGAVSGTLYRYEQESPNSTVFTEKENDPLSNINVVNNSSPAFTDLDNDGRLDLFIVNGSGKIYHYEQAGINSENFDLVTDNFNNIGTGLYGNTSFADLDNDKLLDLIIGRWGTNLMHYEQTSSNPSSEEKELIFTEITSNGASSYLELYNNSDKLLDLQNIKIRYFNDASSEFSETTLSGNIRSREYCLIAQNKDDFETTYEDKKADAEFAEMLLDGGQDAIALVYNGNVIDRFNAEGSDANFWNNGDHFERVDFLTSGEFLINDWENYDAEDSPGEINEADTRTVNGISPNTDIQIGKNGNGSIAVLLNMGSSHITGNMTVKVRRGRNVPNPGNETFIKRYVEIEGNYKPVNGSVTIKYKDSELNGLDENELAVFGYQNGEWTEINTVQRNKNQNWVKATEIDDYLIFSLGRGEETLPVEFSSFNLIQSEEDVLVKWVTQTESDLRGFYVLKSETEDLASARRFSDLIPASNTVSAHEYVCEDKEVMPNKTYWYWIEALSLSDNSSVTASQSIMLGESNDPEEEVPEFEYKTGLTDIYPNPFNPPVNISFFMDEETIDQNVNAEIMIYNVKGQEVHRRDLGAKSAPGIYTISWNGNDKEGKECGSGIYFVKFKAGSSRSFKKSIKLK